MLSIHTLYVVEGLAQQVTINVGSVARTLPDTFHGINYVAFWNSNQGDPKAAQLLGKTTINLVRFPGGVVGDFYDWQCPYYTGENGSPTCPSSPTGSSWSSSSPMDAWNWAKIFGTTMLYQTNVWGNGLPNPPGKNYAVNSPENAAAWAQWTKQQGIKAIFEIGNEIDLEIQKENNWWLDVEDPKFQVYIDAFNAQAQAIHQVDGAIQVFGPVSTNEWHWWNRNLLGMFLKQVGNKAGTGHVDGVSLHFYPSCDSWDSCKGSAQYWLQSGGPWEFIKSTIGAHDTRALPVFISEWHVGPATNGFNPTVSNGLLVADMIGAFALGGVSGHQYFELHRASSSENAYGMLFSDGESRPANSPTPSYYALALWGLMGQKILNASQTANASTEVASYSSLHSDGSVRVLLINKTAQSKTIAIATTGYQLQGGTATIHSVAPVGSNTSWDIKYNGATNPDLTTTSPAPQIKTITQANYAHTLAAYEMAVVILSDGTVTPPTDGGTSDSGPTDGGVSDGASDSGTTDTGTTDGGTSDSGASDSGSVDAGVPDTGNTDTGASDSAPTDSSTTDTGTPKDSGTQDSGPKDTGTTNDTSTADSGVVHDSAPVDAGAPLPDSQDPIDDGSVMTPSEDSGISVDSAPSSFDSGISFGSDSAPSNNGSNNGNAITPNPENGDRLKGGCSVGNGDDDMVSLLLLMAIALRMRRKSK